MSSSFRAFVQYGDWEGTAAADNHDQQEIRAYMREKGLLGEDEFLLGVQLYIGETKGAKLGSVTVRAIIFEGHDNVTDTKASISALEPPIPVRSVSLELELEEFLKLFKRFSVMLTWKPLKLTDLEFETERSIV